MRKVNPGQMPLPLLGVVRATRQRIAADGSYERVDLEWRTDDDEDRAIASGDLVLDADAVASLNDSDPPLLKRAAGEE